MRDAWAKSATVAWMPRNIAHYVVIGVFFLLTGVRNPYRDVGRQTLTRVGWLLLTVVAVATFAGFFAVDPTLRSLRYA